MSPQVCDRADHQRRQVVYIPVDETHTYRLLRPRSATRPVRIHGDHDGMRRRSHRHHRSEPPGANRGEIREANSGSHSSRRHQLLLRRSRVYHSSDDVCPEQRRSVSLPLRITVRRIRLLCVAHALRHHWKICCHYLDHTQLRPGWHDYLPLHWSGRFRYPCAQPWRRSYSAKPVHCHHGHWSWHGRQLGACLGQHHRPIHGIST